MIPQLILWVTSGGFRGGRGTRDPLGTQILSISCSFWEYLAKSYVGAPPPGEILDPPLLTVTVSTNLNFNGHEHFDVTCKQGINESYVYIHIYAHVAFR